MHLVKFKICMKHCRLSLSSVGGSKGCRLLKTEERGEGGGHKRIPNPFSGKGKGAYS